MNKMFFLLLFIANIGYSATVYDTLYINKSTATVGALTFPVCVFNDSTQFKMENAIIEINEGDV